MYSSSTATGGTNNYGHNTGSYPLSTSAGTNTYSVPNRKQRHEMSPMENKPEASNSATNGSAMAPQSRRINPGVFTCSTCNALFTCLAYYQSHRKHHSECNSIKLLCCNHCPYATETQFHYNWHIMSHTGEAPHSCSVCNKTDENDPANTNNHVKHEVDDDDPPSCSMSGKRSVATATTDDLMLLESTPRRYSKEMEMADDANQYIISDAYSPTTHDLDLNQRTAFGQTEEEEEEEEEEGQLAINNGSADQQEEEEDEISDEDDDEEEEVESEEEEGAENSSFANVNQGPPYTKSPNATPGSVPITPVRGRGKGNRKSRAISGSQDGSDDGSGGGELRRKFHCSHCGKSFKTKSHLQRHILTHTGEKPYHCNRCGSKFNQSSSLRNHIIAIHTKEYPHYCPQCSKGFLMPALLHKHLATSHRNK